MRFEFSAPRVDGRLQTHWDALIRVVGKLAIVVDGRHWYEEEDVCLVEFAGALVTWLDKLLGEPVDFVYASLESAEPELIRFVHLGDGTWKLRSPHEGYREEHAVPTEDLILAANSYLGALHDQLPERQRVLALLVEKEEHRRLVHRLREYAS